MTSRSDVAAGDRGHQDAPGDGGLTRDGGSGPSDASRFPSLIGEPKPEPTRTAVLVDRDAPTRAAVARVLADHGFRIVAETDDPAPAGAVTREVRPDLIVLALAPGPDDLPAVAEVTAERTGPVIVLTDDTDRPLLAAVRDAGVHALLPAFPSRSLLAPAVELAVARFAEIAGLTAEVEAAAKRLETRKLIDRAKGLLMTHRGMTEPEAFRWIQRTAMDRRKSSAAVATQVIAEFDRAPISAAS
jgi:response regulator NasT